MPLENGQEPWQLFRQYGLPLVVTYALFIGLLVRFARGSDSEAPETTEAGDVTPDSARGWRALARHLLVTATGGYLCFLGVVLLYYWLVARQSRRFLTEAVTGGAFLAYAVSVPAFLLMTWLAGRYRRRSVRRKGARGS